MSFPVSRFCRIALLTSAVMAVSAPAMAEVQLSLFGGANWAFDSQLTTNKPSSGGGPAIHDSRDIDWEGKPFQAPQYWGARATYWLPDNNPWGVALDYTHQKVYANLNFATDPTYNHLEFTDGNNIITVNAMYRFQNPDSRWGYYMGAGPGVAIPSVEVTFNAYENQPTHRYEWTGLGAEALAGVQYKLTQHVSAFTEGKITYTENDGDLVGGGTVRTYIWSPQVALGVSYAF